MTRKDKNKIVSALQESLGNISEACRIVGISRRAYYDLIQKDKKFAAQCEETREEKKDYVESMLMQKIKDKDTASIIFYLKTICKDRGYVERMENVNSGNITVNINRKIVSANNE